MPLPAKIPLLGPLSTVLPSQEQTRLLQACLWPGERGREAWVTWSGAIGDPANFLRQDKDGVKGLLPLLFDSLQKNGASVAGEFRTYLRTAYLRDELRSRTYSRICRNVIETLAKAGVRTALLKGAALAETCYSSPALQHAHYLDLLIKDHDRCAAVETLRRLDFSGAAGPLSPRSQSIELVHVSGLPLVLHGRLFKLPFYSVDMEKLWERSRTEMISGAPVRLLSPHDNLFHVCGSVLDVECHESLRWVCDAWFLIGRYPDLDWSTLFDCARRSQMVLPLLITTGYLKAALDAPVPAEFLSGLQSAAYETEVVAREAALYALQTNAKGGLKKIAQSCDDWATRAFVFKWALFPSASYLREIHEVSWPLLLPLYYVYRPLKYVARSAWFFGKRVLRRLREIFGATRTFPKPVSS
jgi:hypothetical protein